MKVLAFLALLTLAECQWMPDCGISMYDDAAEGQPWDTPPRVRRTRKDGSIMIVGGEVARPNEFPWQVSLEDVITPSHFCGAVVLNQDYILTAAHCTDGKSANGIKAFTGKVLRMDNDGDGTTRSYDLSAIIQHENYQPILINNDISLLKVATQIVMDTSCVGACAPVASETYAGMQITVSGWGTTSSGGDLSDELLYTNVWGISNTQCSAEYDGITQAMLCADSSGNDRDACQGDSGGPLVYKRNGAFEVIGLVSWGIGCATNPGVYTRVTHFLDWIAENAV